VENIVGKKQSETTNQIFLLNFSGNHNKFSF
jgi:hypothetical protein